MFLSTVMFHDEYKARHILRDGHKQHQLVMSLFEDKGTSSVRSEYKILWRKEIKNKSTALLIQSTVEPNDQWIKSNSMRENIILETRNMDSFLEDVQKLKTISYKITVNPVRKNDGKINPVRGRENIHEWWNGKLTTLGLESIPGDIIVDINNTDTAEKPTGHKIIINSATIVGRAHVKDVQALIQAITEGVGREKPYGFGLLSVSRTYVG